MSSECRAEVRRDAEASAHDFRLNFRLKQVGTEVTGTDLSVRCTLLFS